MRNLFGWYSIHVLKQKMGGAMLINAHFVFVCEKLFKQDNERAHIDFSIKEEWEKSLYSQIIIIIKI